MTDWVKYCDDLLAENGLTRWKTVTSKGRRTIGLCNYTTKTINLSRYMLESDDDAYIIDTIIHEVAHALTPGHRHDAVWRSKAMELGGSGERYAAHSNYPSKWLGMCANGHESRLFRWNKRTVYRCNCSSPLYIRRSDGSRTYLSADYVVAFNGLAVAHGYPEIDSQGRLLPRTHGGRGGTQ